MSFSQDVKKEIIAREAGGSCCAVAAAYGFACFGKYFDTRGVVLHTEQIAVAQYAKKMFARAGVAGKIYVKGSEESRVYEFAVKERARCGGCWPCSDIQAKSRACASTAETLPVNTA